MWIVKVSTALTVIYQDFTTQDSLQFTKGDAELIMALSPRKRRYYTVQWLNQP